MWLICALRAYGLLTMGGRRDQPAYLHFSAAFASYSFIFLLFRCFTCLHFRYVCSTLTLECSHFLAIFIIIS